MKLTTKAQLQQLHKNYEKNQKIIETSSDTIDFKPVIKLFTPWKNCTWLLSELSPEGIGFGLCDLGFGEPEIGYVDLNELMGIRGPAGLAIERDRWFEASKTLSEYAGEARRMRRVAA
jgi:hypothetical protein